MQDLFLYITLSALESTALFFLAFKIFKIDLYMKEIVFAGLIMGFFSYVIRNIYGLPQLDVLIQYLLVFSFLWLLFRIHIFYATIMTAMSYQAYSLIQAVLYLIARTGVVNLHNPVVIPMLQLISASITILIGYYIGKKRKGFDFIPDKPDGRIHIGKRDKVMFILTFPSIIFIILMTYFEKYINQSFYIIPLLYAVILYGYLYLSNKKDRGDHAGQYS
jgi:hypothetical protein